MLRYAPTISFLQFDFPFVTRFTCVMLGASSFVSIELLKSTGNVEQRLQLNTRWSSSSSLIVEGTTKGVNSGVAWQYFGHLHIFGRNFTCAERFRMMNKFLSALSGLHLACSWMGDSLESLHLVRVCWLPVNFASQVMMLLCHCFLHSLSLECYPISLLILPIASRNATETEEGSVSPPLWTWKIER